jgi:hypothetical protein
LIGEAFKSALKAEMTKLELACTMSDTDRFDVVELYRGGKYDLYRYRRYQDARMSLRQNTAQANSVATRTISPFHGSGSMSRSIEFMKAAIRLTATAIIFGGRIPGRSMAS